MKLHRCAVHNTNLRRVIMTKKTYSFTKVISKKAAAKIKPGTWLEIAYIDSKPRVGLLLEEIDTKHSGDCSITLWFPESGTISTHEVHTQIICTLDKVKVPKASPCNKKLRVPDTLKSKK